MISQAKCKFCNKTIDPYGFDWGVAIGIAGVDYAYHQECMEMSGELDEES